MVVQILSEKCINPLCHLNCLGRIDPLIRQLTEYRDFINFKTKEQPE